MSKIKKYPFADYTKAIEINPNYVLSYYNRGVAKEALKDYYGAITDYTKFIEINPNYASAYYNRGIAKYYLGDKNGACQDARKTQDLGNDASQLIKVVCN